MNSILARWNEDSGEAARQAMLACCGAQRWAEAMAALRPIASIQELSETADREWSAMGEADWLEAFACHPRIGERTIAMPSGSADEWSRQEQALANHAGANVLAALAQGNRDYERLFGFTYIVCATGKSADEMLEILKRRLGNDRAAELAEAAEQQRQILQIRLGKWLLQ